MVYYRQSSMTQGTPISSQGYTLANASSTTREITNLPPFTNYTVHVQAIGNPDLLGAVIEEVLVRTNITNPSAIRNLQISATSSSSLLVTWDPPANPNGPISHYIVYYREGETAQTGRISSAGYRTIETTQTMAVIEELDKFTNYTIHVQAFVTEIPYVLEGAIEAENVERTHSDLPDNPPTPPDDVVTSEPTHEFLQILIPEPSQIDTGRIM